MDSRKDIKWRRENLVYRANLHTYSIKIYRTINTSSRHIYNDKIRLKEADEDQSSLLVEIMDFKKKTLKNCKLQRKNKRKKMFFEAYMYFWW